MVGGDAGDRRWEMGMREHLNGMFIAYLGTNLWLSCRKVHWSSRDKRSDNQEPYGKMARILAERTQRRILIISPLRRLLQEYIR
jgi:hypothetical protein